MAKTQTVPASSNPHARRLLRMFEEDRAAVASALKGETAQVLATVLVGLAAIEAVDDIEEIRGALRELRESVRAEMGRVQSLAARIQGVL